ncbi:nucleotidyltransferase family protein [Denitromonas iodatirespirans]|uniref:Nucleotidyltransferase domain-containing protein n=1 Tax=Denitromonas iodatirespirans TaxID=2795389 RepID=A0A944D9V0_DENI1|nr:nucleotidyltransferase domain-containing protein [Denitromonas iodatirespirans]MBT0962639.1 nucleotidyltransferase domain-containing protein [Denitromonas iodatirespirans]
MHPLIERHRDELRALAERYGVRSIKVFGSMARDDADASSDVDLLVETAPDTSGFTLGALLMDAQDILGRHVDLVTEAALHPAMRARVLNEARQL